MQDVFPIYEALWRQAEADGVSVDYDGIDEPAGYFRPPEEGGCPVPVIRIARLYYQEGGQPTRRRCAGAPLGPPDIHAELMTLAHEYGHFKSSNGRTPRPQWEEYRHSVIKFDAIGAAVHDEIEGGIASDRDARFRAAWLAGLTDDDRARILAEKALAWDLGRELLIKLGFEDLARYDEAKLLGLHKYRYKFSMDDLWPEDAEVQ